MLAHIVLSHFLSLGEWGQLRYSSSNECESLMTAWRSCYTQEEKGRQYAQKGNGFMVRTHRHGLVHNAAKITKHWWKYRLIEVSPDVFWKIRDKLLGFPEPEMGILKELCDPARDGLDVGANYGMYTQALRRCCRKVWSFEPQPHFATLLENGYRCDIEAGRLVLYRCALSDTAGHATLRTPLLDRGYSTIEAGNEMGGKVNCSLGVAELTVETKRLDDIELESPGFIKIDVEGHEETVLRGAVATLERHRPNLLVEIENRHREGSVGRVAALLKALDYSGFYLDDDRLVSLDHFRPEVNQNAEFPDKYKRNFIFRPGRAA